MKITNWALIFVIIVFPFFFKNDLRVNAQERTQERMMMYNGALHAAIQDAAFALKLNEQQLDEIRYDSVKKIRANKERAVDAFYESLYMNFGVNEDPVTQGVLKQYIPALAVIDYDGLWIYTDETYENAQQERENKQVWKPKKPYAYKDKLGNSLSFTLDDYVYAYDAQSKSWYEGNREDVAIQVGQNIQLLNDPSLFDQVRRTTIVNTVQGDLEHYINSHNEYARQYGITYTFTLPTISQEEWNNTINDVGVMAFIQGVPLGIGYYNSYSLSGGRLIKAPSIYGYEENGVKVYYRSTDNHPGEVIEKFTSERDAAYAGYFPGR